MAADDPERPYFPFFFSCLAFFFSLAVLAGFFFASFLASIDFAISILLYPGWGRLKKVNVFSPSSFRLMVLNELFYAKFFAKYKVIISINIIRSPTKVDSSGTNRGLPF